MLAHTTLRHIMLSTQFVIGLVLLSASYLTHDHTMSTESYKANMQLQPVVEERVETQERC